jgi:hypothetical protein
MPEMKFTYGSGSRPLDGYTIKRGVGKGGFGEVYFAVSDGGKEVALKLVRGDGEVELRGIQQCLNLKHANLVYLQDLKTGRDGNSWLVMEYVAGKPLHEILALPEHKKGLPRELVRQWFGSLARAVGHLHDRGFVHRDLKPANIFIEDGVLKVGDYGLCRILSASQRGQTQSVGTVHYMAPEISTGNYGRPVDIYACGILLYEMLTGKVPFDGESAGEILMKHLTKTPDLSDVPFEYVPIVARALAKDPAQRYESLAEMARAVESIGRPGAAPVVRPAAPRVMARPDSTPAIEQIPSVVPAPAVSVRGQVGELSGSMAMAAVLALLTTMVLWAAFLQSIPHQDLALMFFLTVGVSWAVLIPGKFWTAQRDRERWGRRLAMGSLGALIGLGAMWLDGWTPTWPLPHRAAANGSMAQLLGPGDPLSMSANAGFLAYFGLCLGALRWWKMTDRRRKHWFSLFPLLAAGFWGGVLLFMLPNYDQRSVGFASLVMAAAIVQCVSPWEAPPPPTPRRLRLRYA